MTRYVAKALWSARKENIDECAERICKFLNHLEKISEELGAWHEYSRKKQKINHSLTAKNKDELKQLLEKGRNKNDLDNAIIDDLGFKLYLCNGLHKEQEAYLKITCGLYTTVEGLTNIVSLDLPQTLNLDISIIEKLLFALSNSWNPDWAVVSSLQEFIDHACDGAFLDKGLYLKHDINKFIPTQNVLLKKIENGQIYITKQA